VQATPDPENLHMRNLNDIVQLEADHVSGSEHCVIFVHLSAHPLTLAVFARSVPVPIVTHCSPSTNNLSSKYTLAH